MNREILFKAKRLDNGEWVEGALLDGVKHCLIGQGIKFSPYIENECKIVGYKVDRNTICQFTGLTDKNGNKIWENDIVVVHLFNEIAEGYGTNRKEQGVICYDSIGMLSLRVDMYEDKPCYSNILFEIELSDGELDIESIGNIFDNADLLGKE